MKVIAFVPIRLNSKRVVGKNILELGGKPLLAYIFETLLRVKRIDEVYAFCSSDSILPMLPEGVRFLRRAESLDSDTTLGREIYEAFVSSIKADVYVLAHTTSPFIKEQTIEHAVQMVTSGGHDSSFSALKFQTFSWFKGEPLNYSLHFVPRTQDIEPVFIETSSFYIFKRELWQDSQRRIGDKPYLQIVDQIEGLDIDHPEDFEVARAFIDMVKR